MCPQNNLRHVGSGSSRMRSRCWRHACHCGLAGRQNRTCQQIQQKRSPQRCHRGQDGMEYCRASSSLPHCWRPCKLLPFLAASSPSSFPRLAMELLLVEGQPTQAFPWMKVSPAAPAPVVELPHARMAHGDLWTTIGSLQCSCSRPNILSAPVLQNLATWER